MGDIMGNNLLPIGTVVLLKGGTKKVMISGYYSKSKDDNKVYQYNGCIFPEGFMDNTFCLFDTNQIEEVCYKGLENDEYDKYVNGINQSVGLDTLFKGLTAPVTSNNNEKKAGRVPKAPTNPKSKSEMLSEYGVKKISGENIKNLRKD